MKLFFFGLIDILEGWSPQWLVQGALLRFVFQYLFCNRWYNPNGITAINPSDYATRFEEFFSVHVLGVPYKSRSGRSWQPFW